MTFPRTGEKLAIPPTGPARVNLPQAVVLAGALACLALVLLPVVVRMTFHVGPQTLTPAGDDGWFGPGAVAWLATLSTAVAALAVGASVWAGARLARLACALAGLGALAGLWHLTGHYENQFVIAGWIGAVAMGLAMLHLAQHRLARRWLVAGFIAILVPMTIDAAFHHWIDQPRLLAFYLDNEAQALEAQGIEPGSAAHQQFERRLRTDGASGALHYSNVFGSLAGALALLAVGVAGAGLLAGRRDRLLAVLPGAIAAGGLLAVLFARSRGAAVALMIGLVVIGIGAWAMRRQGIARQLPALAMTMIVVALAAVVLRGMGGAPSAPGEDPTTTLLLRYHYLQGGAHVIAHDLPGSALLGVGPAQFQSDYIWAKPAQSPEQITTMHNVFADYIVMIGVGGWALAVLVLMWLWQTARRAHEAMHPGDAFAGAEAMQNTALPVDHDDSPMLSLGTLGLAAVPAAVIFATQYLLNMGWSGHPELALRWLVGLLGFVLVMAWTAGLIKRIESTRLGRVWLLLGLLAASVMLVVHNQIEMGFYQFNSVALVWALLGLAAGAGLADRKAGEVDEGSATRMPWLWLTPAVVMVLLALVLAVVHAVPMSKYEQHMTTAGRALARQSYTTAIGQLDAAATVMPTDPQALRWRVQLRLEAVDALARAGRNEQAQAVLGEVFEVLDAAAAVKPNVRRVLRHRAEALSLAADRLNAPNARQRAIEVSRQVVEHTPHSVSDHLRLAELYWQTGDRDAARQVYRQVLVLDEMHFLDPAGQLPEAQVQRIERRIAED